MGEVFTCYDCTNRASVQLGLPQAAILSDKLKRQMIPSILYDSQSRCGALSVGFLEVWRRGRRLDSGPHGNSPTCRGPRKIPICSSEEVAVSALSSCCGSVLSASRFLDLAASLFSSSLPLPPCHDLSRYPSHLCFQASKNAPSQGAAARNIAMIGAKCCGAIFW